MPARRLMFRLQQSYSVPLKPSFVVVIGLTVVWQSQTFAQNDEPLRAASVSAELLATDSTANSNISAEFRERMFRVVSAIPNHIQNGLRRRGWRVQLAEYVVDAAPDLRGIRPRGWPPDSTWENTDAVHLPKERLVILAEKRRTRSGRQAISPRAEGAFRHELGHAFDMASAERDLFRSAQPAFREALDRDIGRLPAEVRSTLHYYLQASSAGRQEAFAEAFAVILGGGSDVDKQQQFLAAFPSTIHYVQNAISDFRP